MAVYDPLCQQVCKGKGEGREKEYNLSKISSS